MASLTSHVSAKSPKLCCMERLTQKDVDALAQRMVEIGKTSRIEGATDTQAWLWMRVEISKRLRKNDLVELPESTRTGHD
jgi:hypothetical protein